MFINKENFPYQIKKEYLSKARIFKIIILIYLFCYLSAIISFIVISYPVDKETRGFLIWMACFGFIPLPILWNICREKLVEYIPFFISEEHHWSWGLDCNEIAHSARIEQKNFFQKLLRPTSPDDWTWTEKGPAWEFVNLLNKINVYGNTSESEGKPLYVGTHADRPFRLDFYYLLNRFSFTGKHGRKHFSNFEGFVLRTVPIKNITSTILIRPKRNCAKKIKNLQKIEIDTQGLFEIYTDDPQTLEQDFFQKFLPTLISYGKNIDRKVTILISPEGIVCTKTKWGMDIVLFTSLRSAFIKEWAKFENFINLLELINLLEPQNETKQA
ncbi:MAG: hypothetical protein J6Y25_00465 [Elusimicrobiaceae bacterium]|nr:hypothetical protein [Elusimicrobiaceae bacterium]